MPRLGSVIDGPDLRDAIHVALAPVLVGDQELAPGTHVGLTDADATKVTSSAKHIGIIDPFLRRPAKQGEKVWLLLYPHTVTSLRHAWVHPAFPSEREDPAFESREWIATFAAEMKYTYEFLMDSAWSWVHSDGDYVYENGEHYKQADYEKWPQFWKHFEVVTGTTVEDHKGTVFTCSC